MNKSSSISGFYKLSPKERLALVKEFAGLSDEECDVLQNTGSLPLDVADRMIENVIGAFPLPLGIGVNFLINNRDYLIPMAIEEPSVVAAGSYAAKKLDAKIIRTTVGPMLITELYVDCRDAMGANAVNTMAEAVAPTIERITGGHVYLRIISNLATKRLAKAWCTVTKEVLGGEEVVEGIVNASAFAAADPYRAATHNKGAMNGIIAVVIATGNDHRAIEAGAHPYAPLKGQHNSLSHS